MTDERRNNNRLGIRLEVELRAENKECSLHSRDLSNGGVFLEKGEIVVPPVDTISVDSIVYLRVKSQFEEGEPPLVKARVVRIDDQGIALQFLPD